MVVISDNTATNLVLDRVTADAVNARLEALGFAASRALKKIGGQGASKAAAEPANQGFGIGVTTPREMDRLHSRQPGLRSPFAALVGSDRRIGVTIQLAEP